MNLRILAEAEEDTQHEAEWYEARQEGLGVAFLAELARTIRTIESNPTRFAKLLASRGGDIRACSLAKFPFQVIYEVRHDELIVLAVAHHKRRPGFWTRRRPGP